MLILSLVTEIRGVAQGDIMRHNVIQTLSTERNRGPVTVVVMETTVFHTLKDYLWILLQGLRAAILAGMIGAVTMGQESVSTRMEAIYQDGCNS